MSAARKSHSPQSTLLAARLKARIARTGPISVADYMETCLADATAGYYPSRQPIGAAGDFITAPEVSQIFGELLGLWAVAAWQSMGEPRDLGRGRTRTGPRHAHGGRAARLGQRARLPRQCVGRTRRDELRCCARPSAWRCMARPCRSTGTTTIADVPHGPLIVIANEFVDALPVRQLLWRDGQWRERSVTIGRAGGFAFCEGAAVRNENLQQVAHALQVPDGSILEVRPAAAALVSALAARAETAPLTALIVDYGHDETACGDTLQAVWRHKYADPLNQPGEVDITAHVDFAALKDSATAHRLGAYGPMPQGEFLLKLGLEARRDRLCETASPEQRQEIASGADRLAIPNRWGSCSRRWL